MHLSWKQRISLPLSGGVIPSECSIGKVRLDGMSERGGCGPMEMAPSCAPVGDGSPRMAAEWCGEAGRE